MFLDYYQLAEQPFGISPDSRFLYLGTKHREALASLVYGTESDRGFLAMIAEPGMGKTSLLHEYLSRLGNKVRTAFVFQTDGDSRDFIRRILVDFGIDANGMDLSTMQDRLNRFLSEEMHAGRPVVLVVDEAQNLEEKTLESVRLLSNFEASWMKPLLIVLSGQSELASKLAKPSLSQLRQRISMVIRIELFTSEETNDYIDHRLRIAGSKNPAVFTPGARQLIAEHSQGVPRNINNICFNAMSLGCAVQQDTIDRDLVSEVIADLDLASLKQWRRVVATPDLSPPSKKCDPVATLDLAMPKKSDVFPAPPPQPVMEEDTVVKMSMPPASKVHDEAELKPHFIGHISRFAVTSMLFLVLVGSVDQAKRSEPRSVDALVSSVTPVSSLIPKPSPRMTPSIEHAEESVRVAQGQTLYRISVKKFGTYNASILEEIRKLNPWLSDPDHLRAGKELLIPSEQ